MMQESGLINIEHGEKDKIKSKFLFVNRNYLPPNETAVTRLCQRISRQACVN